MTVMPVLDAPAGERTATLSADDVLDLYNRIVDVVQGRVSKAEGVAAINAVLHDTLLASGSASTARRR